jgi:hypothetical protein
MKEADNRKPGSEASAQGQSAKDDDSPNQANDQNAEDGSGISKWERDLFRDALSNVNQTLRYQISLGVPLLAACVTVLNLVPPQEHQELLNYLDKWVFIPVLVGMGVAYAGLEQWWYMDKQKSKPDDNLDSLYGIVRYKYHMVHISIFLQGLGLVLLMIFVLIEFK